MRINGDVNKRIYDPSLEPLFQALVTDQPIASITIMQGRINKDDTSKDIVLNNVVASDYWQGMGANYDSEKDAYVDNDFVDATPHNFYMDWVRSYTL
jgi:hypothetical protein